jgi:hypothetical protein
MAMCRLLNRRICRSLMLALGIRSARAHQIQSFRRSYLAIASPSLVGVINRFRGGKASATKAPHHSNNSPKWRTRAEAGNRQASRPGLSATDHLNLSGTVLHAHRTGQSHPPPLLKSKSTNRSSTSSPSTGLSAFFSPRTPMEPPLGRATSTATNMSF